MSAEAILLKDRYEIRFDEPLPGVAPTGTSAYAARDRRSPGPSLVALIPNTPLPIRVAAATAIRTLRHPNLWTPLEWGIVDCPPINRKGWVVVGDFPDGGRLVIDNDGKFAPWTEADIRSKLLVSLLPALQVLATERISHRSVRVTNLWYRDALRRVVMLGDGIACPPAMTQPAVYEPIEAAMALPVGRGAGWVADDLYALGVTILHLLRGEKPCGDLNDDAILDAKIANGSFSTVATGVRLSPSFVELCRGLLADNQADRWGVTDLGNWLDERRRPYAPPTREHVATRPILVGTKQCLTSRDVARAVCSQGEVALEVIRGRGFDTWVTRALMDPQGAERVTKALVEGDDAEPSVRSAKLAARVAIALDPEAPIRHRKLAASPDGLGPVLAMAFLTKDSGETIKAVAEIIHGRLVPFWITCQAETSPEFEAWNQDHERLRVSVTDHRPSHGIERAVYDLNRRIHCLSPTIEPKMVTTISGLLAALDSAAEEDQVPSAIIDRHIAAFIASRTKLLTEGLAARLGSTAALDRMLATLTLLAQLQNDHGPERVRSLALLFRPQFPLAINRLRSRALRQRVLNKAEDAAESGQLALLLRVIDDADERAKDQQLFARAAAQCAEAGREIRRYQGELEVLSERGAETGRTVAALVAVVCAGLTMIVSALSIWAPSNG